MIRILLDGLLANAGLTIRDVKTVLVPNLVRGIDELMAGRVDVSFFALGQAKVSEADAAIGIRFLPVDDSPAAVKAMLKVVQVGYVAKVNPAPHLAGVKAIPVAHYDYVAFANKDLATDKVKTITRVLAEQAGTMAQTLPLFRQLKPERMYTKQLYVPYHPGSISYYDEKGIKELSKFWIDRRGAMPTKLINHAMTVMRAAIIVCVVGWISTSRGSCRSGCSPNRCWPRCWACPWRLPSSPSRSKWARPVRRP